jgi:photosystem II stability/assembly factor-like uncharacterized protein
MRIKWSVVVLALSVAALAAPGSAAAAGVSVGHSGWFWGNPLPQGNTIRTLDFAGGRGFAAGEFGTLLRTDDGGATWSGVPTGITSDLSKVDVVDPNTVIIGGGCSARRSDNAGVTFHRLPFTPSELRCGSRVQSISFSSGTAGFLLLQDGTLLSTSDGGASFSRKTAIPGTAAHGDIPSATPTDIFFTSPTTGYAVTKLAGSGSLYRTVDGGNTWNPVAGAAGPFEALWFSDPTTGYAVGDNNTLFATVDSGATWNQRPLTGATPSTLVGVRCSGLTCLFSTAEGSRLIRSTDGGVTGTDVAPSTQKIFAAAFQSPTQAVAAGQNGATVVSGDAGVTFSPVPASGGRIPGPFLRLKATSASVAFATGRNGTLARTVDGGQTWTDLGVPTTGDVLDVSFPVPGTGYALDNAGSLLKSSNGGTSWGLLNTNTSSRPNAVLALDAQRVLLIGPRGILRSADGGNSFASVRGRGVPRTPLSRGDVARGAVFAYGARSLIVSTNGGSTWSKVKRPSKASLRTVDFVTGKRGYALDANGRVWSTSNRGKHWTQLVATGTLSAYNLAFTAANRGYLAVNSFGLQRGGFLLKTSDGGQTWHPQLVSRNALAPDGIATSSAATDFAMDNAGGLFATTSGGDQGAASSLKLTTKTKTLRRRTTIKVNGKLNPAAGGEQVVVSARAQDHGWVHKVVQVASNGTFTTVWRVSRLTIFVAQWTGDADHAGAGSKVLQVQVGKRPRR